MRLSMIFSSEFGITCWRAWSTCWVWSSAWACVSCPAAACVLTRRCAIWSRHVSMAVRSRVSQDGRWKRRTTGLARNVIRWLIPGCKMAWPDEGRSSLGGRYRTVPTPCRPFGRAPSALLGRRLLGLGPRHESVDEREIAKRLDLPRKALYPGACSFDACPARIGIADDVPDRTSEVTGIARFVGGDVVAERGDHHRQAGSDDRLAHRGVFEHLRRERVVGERRAPGRGEPDVCSGQRRRDRVDRDAIVEGD